MAYRIERVSERKGGPKMPKYIIEREIPGIGQAPREAHREGARKSKAVLNELGPDIQWVESYVSEDRIFCVYISPNEKMIREHAAKAGIPVSRISEVKMVVDPTMAE
jgi:hypothetical protein